MWASFAVGATLGGATTGVAVALASGLASALPEALRAAATVAGVVALAVLDVRSPVLRLPQRETLIPQEVFAAGMMRGIARFGYEYGSGVRTLVPSAASYILAWTLVMANLPWWQTIALGAVFGFARSWAAGLALAFSRGGWSVFLGRHSRLLERAGSVTAAALVVAWILLAPG